MNVMYDSLLSFWLSNTLPLAQKHKELNIFVGVAPTRELHEVTEKLCLSQKTQHLELGTILASRCANVELLSRLLVSSGELQPQAATVVRQRCMYEDSRSPLLDVDRVIELLRRASYSLRTTLISRFGHFCKVQNVVDAVFTFINDEYGFQAAAPLVPALSDSLLALVLKEKNGAAVHDYSLCKIAVQRPELVFNFMLELEEGIAAEGVEHFESCQCFDATTSAVSRLQEVAFVDFVHRCHARKLAEPTNNKEGYHFSALGKLSNLNTKRILRNHWPALLKAAKTWACLMDPGHVRHHLRRVLCLKFFEALLPESRKTFLARASELLSWVVDTSSSTDSRCRQREQCFGAIDEICQKKYNFSLSKLEITDEQMQAFETILPPDIRTAWSDRRLVNLDAGLSESGGPSRAEIVASMSASKAGPLLKTMLFEETDANERETLMFQYISCAFRNYDRVLARSISELLATRYRNDDDVFARAVEEMVELYKEDGLDVLQPLLDIVEVLFSERKENQYGRSQALCQLVNSGCQFKRSGFCKFAFELFDGYPLPSLLHWSMRDLKMSVVWLREKSTTLLQSQRHKNPSEGLPALGYGLEYNFLVALAGHPSMVPRWRRRKSRNGEAPKTFYALEFEDTTFIKKGILEAVRPFAMESWPTEVLSLLWTDYDSLQADEQIQLLSKHCSESRLRYVLKQHPTIAVTCFKRYPSTLAQHLRQDMLSLVLKGHSESLGEVLRKAAMCSLRKLLLNARGGSEMAASIEEKASIPELRHSEAAACQKEEREEKIAIPRDEGEAMRVDLNETASFSSEGLDDQCSESGSDTGLDVALKTSVHWLGSLCSGETFLSLVGPLVEGSLSMEKESASESGSPVVTLGAAVAADFPDDKDVDHSTGGGTESGSEGMWKLCSQFEATSSVLRQLMRIHPVSLSVPLLRAALPSQQYFKEARNTLYGVCHHLGREEALAFLQSVLPSSRVSVRKHVIRLLLTISPWKESAGILASAWKHETNYSVQELIVDKEFRRHATGPMQPGTWEARNASKQLPSSLLVMLQNVKKLKLVEYVIAQYNILPKLYHAEFAVHCWSQYHVASVGIRSRLIDMLSEDFIAKSSCSSSAILDVINLYFLQPGSLAARINRLLCVVLLATSSALGRKGVADKLSLDESEGIVSDGSFTFEFFSENILCKLVEKLDSTVFCVAPFKYVLGEADVSACRINAELASSFIEELGATVMTVVATKNSVTVQHHIDFYIKIACHLELPRLIPYFFIDTMRLQLATLRLRYKTPQNFGLALGQFEVEQMGTYGREVSQILAHEISNGMTRWCSMWEEAQEHGEDHCAIIIAKGVFDCAKQHGSYYPFLALLAVDLIPSANEDHGAATLTLREGLLVAILQHERSSISLHYKIMAKIANQFSAYKSPTLL